MHTLNRYHLFKPFGPLKTHPIQSNPPGRYFAGNKSTTQICIRTAAGALITISILLGPIRIPQLPSVKFRTHWELSHSYIKTLYYILKKILC